MNIVKKVQHDFRTLRDGEPGSRFRNFAEQRRQRSGGDYKTARFLKFGLAGLLIVVGLGIGWLPGPGGFLAIIGLAMIAQEIPAVASAMDATEVWLRRMLGSLKRRFGVSGS